MKYTSILEAVAAAAATQPDKLCLADSERELSYGEYMSFIRRLASALSDMGVGGDARVVVEARQRADFLAIELALQLLGAVFVPVERGCAHEKIAGLARRCGALLTVTLLDMDAPDGGHCGYERLLGAAEIAAEHTAPLPRPEAVSEILFSTGTTGREKGIVLTHASAVAVGENILYGSHMLPDNVELIPSPLNHSHGLRSYYANMLCGGTVVLVDSVMDMRRFFGCLEKYKVTAIDLVPAALTVILKLSHDKLGAYREQLRYLEFGSAPMADADRAAVRRLLPGIPLLNYYGSTESGRVAVFDFNSGSGKRGCIGRPTRNAELIIVDAERRPVQSSAERPGLLASRGGMNMLGYWQDAAETDAVMDGGFIYSNDEAYFDADGDIILLGRVGDVINVGGNKVAPSEVEDAAKGHPDVADCGCVGVSDELTGSAPKLFVQLEPGSSLDVASIKAFIAGKLENYKVPKYVVAIEKLPRSYNGKLLRRELTKLK